MNSENVIIQGVAPKTFMELEDIVEVQGSGKKPYKLIRRDDHYYCSCPAWIFIKEPIQLRSCKHLKALLGEHYEAIRTSQPFIPKASPYKSSSSPKKRTVKDEDDDDDDYAPSPRKKSSPSKASTSAEPAPLPGTLPTAPPLMLAAAWKLDGGKSDASGMWASEKLDGVRAFWDGASLWSRNGIKYNAPSWWTDRLPKKYQLDGELFVKRDFFDTTSGWCRGGSNWDQISYFVFDVVGRKEVVEDRWELAAKLPDGRKSVDQLIDAGQSQIALLQHVKIRSNSHLKELLDDVEAKGGEGLMLRTAQSEYKAGRSHKICFKVKTFYDGDALLTGYSGGTGKYTDMVGSLKLKMASGATFEVGSGLTDALRANPPAVGSIINYRFQELSHKGIPRLPTYLGVRFDKTKPEDAVVRSAELRAKGKGSKKSKAK